MQHCKWHNVLLIPWCILQSYSLLPCPKSCPCTKFRQKFSTTLCADKQRPIGIAFQSVGSNSSNTHVGLGVVDDIEIVDIVTGEPSTYIVLSGTLNSTIPYHSAGVDEYWKSFQLQCRREAGGMPPVRRVTWPIYFFSWHYLQSAVYYSLITQISPDSDRPATSPTFGFDDCYDWITVVFHGKH